MPESSTPRPGTFIVRTSRDTRSGLAAHEVVELLAADPLEIIEVLRVHNVLPGGRLELVGVSLREFERMDGLVFPRGGVSEARRDYESIAAAARENPPPCRLELQLAHVRGAASQRESAAGDAVETTHVTALLFPVVCMDAVHAWLRRADLSPQVANDGLPMAFEAFEVSAPHVVLRETLHP